MISESVENKANEVLLSMLNGVEQASAFVVEQAPDVVQQLLTWHLVESLIYFVISLVMLGVGSLLAKKAARFFRSDKDKDEAQDIMSMFEISGGVLLVIFGLILVVDHLDWLQIWIAPKLYLLEYAAELAK